MKKNCRSIYVLTTHTTLNLKCSRHKFLINPQRKMFYTKSNKNLTMEIMNKNKYCSHVKIKQSRLNVLFIKNLIRNFMFDNIKLNSMITKMIKRLVKQNFEKI